MSEVRKRTFVQNTSKGSAVSEQSSDHVPETNVKDRECTDLAPGTYWLTRIVLTRWVAFIYLVAFLVALNQNEALLGSRGLLPADRYLDRVKQHISRSIRNADTWSGRIELFMNVPTILWFVDYHTNIDFWLTAIAVTGCVLSAFILIRGGANTTVQLVLWLLYHSLVNIGQRWYSFGWESQLLETGFLAAFLSPFTNWRCSALPAGSKYSVTVMVLFRWLIFRIMLGAGLIKVRGDVCWRDLTCMNYHYETQPNPHPAAWYMHQSPAEFHAFETLVNHFVELIAPFFLLSPFPLPWAAGDGRLAKGLRAILHFGGLLQVVFQLAIIASGNLSFLNWLTIGPALACFDDRCFSFLFGKSTLRHVRSLQNEAKAGAGTSRIRAARRAARNMLDFALLVLIGLLSLPVLRNLMSAQQAMNTSFDAFRLVNTYGAFGSVTRERTEVILQGTRALDHTKASRAEWIEFEFKCKPVNVSQQPCLITPYHYRLDWLMWFAGFQRLEQNEWLLHLSYRLLQNDPLISSLIRSNPFIADGGGPPRWIRAELYHYSFSKLGSTDAQEGRWWKRRRISSYMPAVTADSLVTTIRQLGWPT